MLTFVLFSIVVGILAIIVESKLRKRRLLPPGPFQWPFIGNVRLLQTLSIQYGGQHRAFIELSKRYSSNLVSLRLGKQNIVAVSGYKEIHKILTAAEFDGRPWNEYAKLRNMGLKKGITMADGPEWKEMRVWFAKSLREIGFGRIEMSAHVDEELQTILDTVQHGGVFSMQTLLAPAVANVIWTLGTSRRMFNDSRWRQLVTLIKSRSEAFDIVGGILSEFPWIRYIAPETSGYNLLLRGNNEIKARIMETIEDHKRKYVPGGTSGDLIDRFLEKMYSEKEERSMYDDDQLFVVLLDLLITGTSTTSAILDFLFLRMTVNQDVQRRLHAELDLAIGHDCIPELNDRPKLPYTEAVITETHRMQTALPIIPRCAMSEIHVEGYKIPKESCILLNIWSIHMNPEFYPNPESFEPERYIKNGVHVPDEKLIAFGRGIHLVSCAISATKMVQALDSIGGAYVAIGHRRCPGESEARLIVFLFFVRIMHRFKLVPKPGQEPPDIEPIPGMNIAPKPYEVLLVPRQRA